MRIISLAALVFAISVIASPPVLAKGGGGGPAK